MNKVSKMKIMQYLLNLMIEKIPGENLLRVQVHSGERKAQVLVIMIQQLVVVLLSELHVGAREDEVREVFGDGTQVKSLVIYYDDFALAILEKGGRCQFNVSFDVSCSLQESDK
jgi:hypothetical protein